MEWPFPHFEDFTDELIDELLAERKLLGRSIRRKEKAAHVERGYELTAGDEPERTYQVFTRQAKASGSIFSCGLILTLPGRRLMLCRYNGAYHSHRNALPPREHLRGVAHRHLARAIYLAKGLDGDSYAEPRYDFTTLDGALHCLVRDCAIIGIETEPEQPDFFKSSGKS